MPPAIAAAFCLLGICFLFWLDQSRDRGVSAAIWIPITWLSISSSRFVSQWLEITSQVDPNDPFVEGNPLDATIFALLLLAGIVVLVARRRRSWSVARVNILIAIFFIYCVVSVSWSDFPFVAFKRWVKAFGDLVMLTVVLTEEDPTTAVKRFLSKPGFVLVPLSILLIRYFPALGRGYSPWTGEAFNIGVSTGKNGLGYVCLIFGLASVWCLINELKSNARYGPSGHVFAHVIMLVLVLWLLKMAHSATSLGCFLIGSTLIVLASFKTLSRQSVVVGVLVVTLLFVAVYGLILNPEVGLAKVAGRDSTLTGRTALWELILTVPVSPIVGAGYESFWLGERLQYIWSQNWEHPNQAHNGYLEIFLDLGWIGIVLLATVMLGGFWNIVTTLRVDAVVGSLRIALFVVAAVYNLTEHAFRELHPVWILFLLSVIAVPQTWLARHVPKTV